MTNESKHGYRVAVFIHSANQYLFVGNKLKDGSPEFNLDRMNACRLMSRSEADGLGQDIASSMDTTYVIEPWYETGREAN